MIKDTLLFLWIFIVPILFWIGKLFFSKKKKKIKLNYSQKKVLEVFFLFDIFFYIMVLPILFGPLFKGFQESIHILCMFQIMALDIGFLYIIFFQKMQVSKIFEKSSFFISLCSFIVCVIIFVTIIYFHAVSILEVFVGQKVPPWLIIFVLFFNPIYMFCKSKEELLKND